MSHDHGWRAACGMTIWIPQFHFESLSIARGVTAMVVGSGDLLGILAFRWFLLMEHDLSARRSSLCEEEIENSCGPESAHSKWEIQSTANCALREEINLDREEDGQRRQQCG